MLDAVDKIQDFFFKWFFFLDIEYLVVDLIVAFCIRRPVAADRVRYGCYV